jgi:hypothetical protein
MPVPKLRFHRVRVRVQIADRHAEIFCSGHQTVSDAIATVCHALTIPMPKAWTAHIADNHKPAARAERLSDLFIATDPGVLVGTLVVQTL